MRLIQGDCIEEMIKLIDEGIKVDLILTDLPYGTTDNSWDNIIPLNDMWECINNLSTSITTTLLFGSEPFSTKLKMSNINKYKYDLYWIKNRPTGFVHAKNKPLKNLELISVFSNGTTVHKGQSKNRMTYNPQGLILINKEMKSSKNKFGNMNGNRPSHKKKFIQKYTNYPKMTINFNVVSHKNLLHPTQKPVDLLKYLIKTYSNENDIILDFTMGSGSTGVACAKTNRRFIGIELDNDYFKIAKKRLKNIQCDLI